MTESDGSSKAPGGAEMSDQDIARACGASMLVNDNTARDLGMSLDHIAPGEASMTMTITDAMTNGHKTCHGGYIFTLADAAFAFSCNSRNQKCVAQHCQVSFLKPAFAGDVLTARAKERWREARSGIYDVEVINQAGETVAEFRGHSRTVKGTHLNDDTETQSTKTEVA